MTTGTRRAVDARVVSVSLCERVETEEKGGNGGE